MEAGWLFSPKGPAKRKRMRAIIGKAYQTTVCHETHFKYKRKFKKKTCFDFVVAFLVCTLLFETKTFTAKAARNPALEPASDATVCMFSIPEVLPTSPVPAHSTTYRARTSHLTVVRTWNYISAPSITECSSTTFLRNNHNALAL